MKRNTKNHFEIFSKLSSLELKKLQHLLENEVIHQISLDNFQNDYLDDLTREMFESYSSLKSIFYVSKNDFGSKFLKKLIQNNSLQSLFITTINFKIDSEVFINLKRVKTLETLSITNSLSFYDSIISEIINNNTNLETLILKDNHTNSKENENFLRDLNDNSSIKDLEIRLLIKDYSFLKKFKNLNSLNIFIQKFDMNKVIKNLYRDITPKLKNIHFQTDGIVSGLASFDWDNMLKTSITSYDFNNIKIPNQSIKNILNTLKKVQLKNLDISGTHFAKDRDQIPFYNWIHYLKEIIKNIEDLNISYNSYNQEELNYLIEGFEVNNSLKSFLASGCEFGNTYKDLGKALKSKKNLEFLEIGINEVSIYDFMSEFQYSNGLRSFRLNGKIDKDSDVFLLKFICNNKDLEHLDILASGSISESTLKLILNAIESHSKIQTLSLCIPQMIPTQSIINLISNNSSLNYLCINDIKSENIQALYDLFIALSKNRYLRFIYLNILDEIDDDKLKTIIDDYLVYNYSLIDCYFGGIHYTPKERNLGFITDFYNILPLKRDTYFWFQ